MNIVIKLFLLIYLLAMVLVTVFGVIWIMTAIFTPEWLTKRVTLLKYQKK